MNPASVLSVSPKKALSLDVDRCMCKKCAQVYIHPRKSQKNLQQSDQVGYCASSHLLVKVGDFVVVRESVRRCTYRTYSEIGGIYDWLVTSRGGDVSSIREVLRRPGSSGSFYILSLFSHFLVYPEFCT